ncbi:MAG: hypothetical protein AB8C95_02355, partial [Phycisphaeraceae bacterium]
MAFTWIDWTVIAVFMLGTTVLGHWLGGKSRGMDGFFLGGRDLPWWAVSCSIMASQLSAVTVIAVPGLLYRDDGNLLFLQGTLLGFVLAKFLMAYLFVKPFYERKIYSPYEFIEHRLGQSTAQLSRGLFMISAILGHGIRLLTVALVLNVVADISIGTSILIIAAFSILWTLMGGIKTVIWTDFILFITMVLGGVVSLLTIANALPFGLGEAVRQLDEAAKLKLIDVSLDPAKTWTLWTGLICFAIFELAQNSVDQVITQRMICCKNARQARKAVLGSLGIVLFTLLFAAVGLAVWLNNQHFKLDAASTAMLAEQPSRAYPHFILHQLPTGVSGLLIAGIFAAGISTLDSALAALSETSVNGIYRKWIRPDATEQQSIRISRFAVVGWAIALGSLAYIAGQFAQDEGLLNLAYKAPLLTYGPMLMIALCALKRWGSPPTMIVGGGAAVAVALALFIAKKS